MATSYDEALVTLHRAALESFVAERKRLSAELKASGDKAGAERLAKLGRPSVSAWAVNQLWWHSRAAFDELFATAEPLRQGDIAAAAPHRRALAQLRAHAVQLLGEAGHAASEATLRRVMATLSALAALGSFDPDPPGALSADRDPPGFEAIGSGSAEPAAASPAPTRQRSTTQALTETGRSQRHAETERSQRHAETERSQRHAETERSQRHAEAERTKQAAEAERAKQAAEAERAKQAAEAERVKRRAEAERAKLQGERERLRGALKLAKSELDARASELRRLQKELAQAEAALEKAGASARELEAELAGVEQQLKA